MNLFEIRYHIEQSWSKQSTYCPEYWNEQNPAFGQCAVSSLLLHTILKTERQLFCRLLKCKVNNNPHYFNEINGIAFDLTWRQFNAGTKVTDIEECREEELLDTPWKIDCYQALKNKYYQIQFSRKIKVL